MKNVCELWGNKREICNCTGCQAHVMHVYAGDHQQVSQEEFGKYCICGVLWYLDVSKAFSHLQARISCFRKA